MRHVWLINNLFSVFSSVCLPSACVLSMWGQWFSLLYFKANKRTVWRLLLLLLLLLLVCACLSVCILSIQHASHKNQHTLLKAATTIHRTATTIHNSTQALSVSKSRQTIHSLAMAQRQPFKQYLGRANFLTHSEIVLNKNDEKLKIFSFNLFKTDKLPFDLKIVLNKS